MNIPASNPYLIAGKQILVLGAGFGGLTFCQTFKHPGTTVTLVDARNHHLFQPLLYQGQAMGSRLNN